MGAEARQQHVNELAGTNGRSGFRAASVILYRRGPRFSFETTHARSSNAGVPLCASHSHMENPSLHNTDEGKGACAPDYIIRERATIAPAHMFAIRR